MAYTDESYTRLTDFMNAYQMPEPIQHPVGIYAKPVTQDEAAHPDQYVLAHRQELVYHPDTHEYTLEMNCYRQHAIDLVTGKEVPYTMAEYRDPKCFENVPFMPRLTDNSGHPDEGLVITGYFTDTRNDLIIIGQAILSVSELQLDGQHSPWHFIKAFLVDKDKCMYLWEDAHKRIVSLEHASKDMILKLFTNSYGDDPRLYDINKPMQLDLKPVVTTLFPEVYYPTTGRASHTCASWHDFLNYLLWKPIASKTSKRIEHVVEKPLPDIPKISETGKRLVIQKVEDGLSVMRFLRIDSDDEHTVIEDFRIYVTPKEAISCGRHGDGWGSKKLTTCTYNWRYHVHPFTMDDVKGTKLEYFYTVIQSVHEEYQSLLLWACMVEPLVEQLAKLGMAGALSKMLYDSSCRQMSLKTMLSHMFGPILKTGSPSKRLGVNNYQLQKLITHMSKYYRSDCLQKLKLVLNEDTSHFLNYNFLSTEVFTDISSLDNKTFDILFKFFTDDDTFGNTDHRNFFSVLAGIHHIYGMHKMIKMTEMLQTAFDQHAVSQSFYTASLYDDYLHCVERLQKFQPKLLPCEFDVNDPENSIREMHDAANELYDLHQSEILQAQFDDANARIQKWLYEKNEFKIIAPASADDLVNEGTILHHCVGSYVDRVCNGDTNILFLREAIEPDRSYYTIEVSPDGTIQQIHGMCNHNLDPNSKEELFVKQWAKAKHLKLGHYNQVR